MTDKESDDLMKMLNNLSEQENINYRFIANELEFYGSDLMINIQTDVLRNMFNCMEYMDTELSKAKATFREMAMADILYSEKDEILKLKAENARLVEALKDVERLDKTEYDYGTPDRNGRLPDGIGQRWRTPREIARNARQPSADAQK